MIQKGRWWLIAGFLLCGLGLAWLIQGPAGAQTLQRGADAASKGVEKLRVDYVGYRAARCETEHVTEPQNERPNRGGLIYLYLTNVSDEPINLAFWRWNDQDESDWRLGGRLAWDRCSNENPKPGEMTILEIDAVTEDFAPGKPFTFAYVDRNAWMPVCRCKGELVEDPIRMTYIRVLPGMREIEVHICNAGAAEVSLESLGFVGHNVLEVKWTTQAVAPSANTIARVTLDKALTPSDLIIARLGVKDGKGVRSVYAHRRAFEDWFPIGVWTVTPDTYAVLRRLHVDTVVQGGRADDEFYSQAAAKYGFRTMVHTGMPIDADCIRSLGNHPAVACWMLADEPDWNTQADVMNFVDRSVRAYNSTKPTYINLCRNVKFFEYAPICDIPSMDHYSVTAPTSSKWPKPYGTYLEETAYYTRDLKIASEPKPIWVWSQAIANWSERPKRPVPTPNELAAQLMLNLGRGAKGMIWFNYDQKIADQYPEVREAMGHWGRVLELTRNDFVASEPYRAEPKAPQKVDVAALATWDKVLLCITNLNYRIDPEAYPFRTQKDVRVTIGLPKWITPKAALLIAPDGVTPVSFDVKDGRAEIRVGDLEAAKLVVLPNDPTTEKAYKDRYAKAIEDERREF